MMFGRGYNGFSNCFGSGFMYGGWGRIMMATFIILGIVIVIYFAKKSRNNNSTSEALESLKIRFAKGEITEDEYLKKKNILD